MNPHRTFGSCGARALLAAVSTLGLAVLAGCGDDEKLPTVVTTPTPTPTPAPTPTPTPPPAPTQALACGADLVSGDGRCVPGNKQYAADIEEAIDHAIGTGAGVSGTRIVSTGRYILDILATLQSKGYCASYDGEEVQVKRDNNFHEQYDIVLASGFVRRGAGAYRVTCTPAAFPTPAPPLFPLGGCLIGASREVACGRDDDGAKHLAAVEAAIDAARAKNPANYNGNRVRDGETYQDDVVAFLTQAGFCARTDYEEVSLKNTNDFSENYDILLANGDTRRGRGAYRVSCFPAHF